MFRHKPNLHGHASFVKLSCTKTPYDYYYVDSIALIDLVSGGQDILITGIEPEEELFPIQWTDDNHVLISNINPVYYAGNKTERHWTLDINSGQLEEENP